MFFLFTGFITNVDEKSKKKGAMKVIENHVEGPNEGNKGGKKKDTMKVMKEARTRMQ